MPTPMKSFRSSSDLKPDEMKKLIHRYPLLVDYIEVKEGFWEEAEKLRIKKIIEKWEGIKP